MSSADRRQLLTKTDLWRRRLLVGCEVSLAQLDSEQIQHPLDGLRADITRLRDRLAAELDASPAGSAIADQQIGVRVDAHEGGVVIAADLECALHTLAPSLNRATITAIGTALDYAVRNTDPRLSLTQSQAIALLAEIRHARDDRLAPLSVAIKTALTT
jgi:hypothetical protein